MFLFFYSCLNLNLLFDVGNFDGDVKVNLVFLLVEYCVGRNELSVFNSD